MSSPLMPTPRAEMPRASVHAAGVRRRDEHAGTDRLVEYGPHDPHRDAVERFIRWQYLAHFGARVGHFMPRLAALQAADGALRAAVGYRGAAHEPLFLEAYTERPIERMLRRHLGVDVPRSRIVEVGSLACRTPRAAVHIVKALIPSLLEAGFTWVVFTGADTVQNVCRHLRLAPVALCAAMPSALGAARDDWGTYYDHDPLVMAGRIADGLGALTPRGSVQ